MSPDIATVAREIIDAGPPDRRAARYRALPRLLHHADLLLATPGGRVMDLGAGIGVLPLVCQRLGLQYVVVDDFNDTINATDASKRSLQAYERAGVEIISADATTFTPPDAPLDVLCSFDSIEHWHHSPRPALEKCVARLRPGGRVVIGVPNAVDIVNRIRVVMGRSNMARWSEYWEPEVFRSHVREWTVSDLRTMADALDLVDVTVNGRNWTLPRPAARVLDHFPSLSGTLYLLGRKPD